MDILTELEKLRLLHYECEDGWYSCPKSPDGSFNDNVGDDCICGADRHNEILDKIINYLKAKKKEMQMSIMCPLSRDTYYKEPDLAKKLAKCKEIECFYIKNERWFAEYPPQRCDVADLALQYYLNVVEGEKR